MDTAWPRAPVVGLVRVVGEPHHRVLWDGDQIVPLTHDEGDAVLVALGGEPCSCQRLALTWSVVRADPELLPLLLDPPRESNPRRSAEVQAVSVLARTAASFFRGRPQPVLQRLFDRQVFIEEAAVLGSDFLRAMARAVVSDIAGRWNELLESYPAERAVEDAVRLLLADAVPSLDQTKLIVECAADTPVGDIHMSTDPAMAVLRLGPRWLPEIAANGLVREWWGRYAA